MKYKITNTTVKPVKKGPNGTDLRTAVEKVGHAVQFRNAKDQVIVLHPGRMTIIEDVDPGLLNLQRGGFIKIEPIKDISAALKEHALQDSAGLDARKKAAEGRKNENRKATAVEMGKDTHSQKGGAEHDDAVNPDGDPNFLAKAPSKKTKGRTKGTEVVSDANSNAAGSVGDTAL